VRPLPLFAICFLSATAIHGQAVITTLAGAPYGTCGYSGDNGPAAQAVLCNPQMTITDNAGNIYFSDAANSVIRMITPAGIISTIAGNGKEGTTGDGGAATSASLGAVYQLAYDGVNNLCFGDFRAYKIRCVSLSTGIIQGYGTGSPVSAGDGGQFANASFYMPLGVVFVQRSVPPTVYSDLYIADNAANVVRKVDGMTGIISTIAGTGLSGPLGDGGPATSATLQSPWSLTYFNGSLYIADSGNDRIRAVNLSTGIINTVVGNGSPYFAGDGGPATSAGISPRQVTFDPVGQMYVSDTGRIRKVDLSGNISTYAGNGDSGIGPDNVPPSQTYFSGVQGVDWNSLANQLLISDGVNKIRQVIYQGTTTSVAATPNSVPPGGQVTITATVSASGATGTVNFYVNSALVGSAPVSAGQAIFNWTATGSNSTADAIYVGDATYAPSSSGVVGITIQKNTTTTTLTSSPNPSNQNQTVTMTAAVTPSTATGTVQFYGAGALLGSATVNNGSATFSYSFANAGPVTLYATYGGDANNANSTSANVTQTVLATTAVALSSGQNPSAVGTAVTFLASVTPSAATGTVQFLDGGATLGSASLSGGSASFSATLQTQGTHSITAVYSGDSNDAAATSAVLSQSVKAVTGLALVWQQLT
jgi:large repetitive protein